MYDLNDFRFIKDFDKTIDEKIDKKLAKAGFCILKPAKVTNVDGGDGSLTIYFNGESSNTVSGVLNRTNQTLIADDNVEVIFVNNSNKYYALIKK